MALGAYTAAFLTSALGILHLEVIVLAAMAVALVVAVPIGLLCVRYVKIYFGMLTLAFGMLFYSFLFKFYHLTGGTRACVCCGPSSSARASVARQGAVPRRALLLLRAGAPRRSPPW